jgi:hypothetical protein
LCSTPALRAFEAHRKLGHDLLVRNLAHQLARGHPGRSAIPSQSSAHFNNVAAFSVFIAWHQCSFIYIFFSELEEDAALQQLARWLLAGRYLSVSVSHKGVSQ